MTGTNNLPILTFLVGEQWYGLPISDVIEVAAMVELAMMPGAPPELLGVADRHGQPLSIVDLRRVFDAPFYGVDANTLFIVASMGSRTMGMVVDEVHQVEYIPLENTGYTLAAGKYIRGIISYKERLIQLIALAPLLGRYVSGADAELAAHAAADEGQ
ncbi:MAG: chemotaxis protein CheW [bacterium]|nr:chemotaxis protein CheW [bacterium]